MKYRKFRLVWDSPSGEPAPRPSLTGRLVGRIRGVVHPARREYRRRIRAWTPWLRPAAKAAVVIAALAFIVVLGIKHPIHTPPTPGPLPADPAGSRTPSDNRISTPAPWDVRIPQLQTPGPAVPTVDPGFRDLPDLSALLGAGAAHAAIRGGTSGGGLPPQVNGTVVATTLGFLAVIATVVGAIRRWLRWWRGAPPDDVDASAETHRIDEADELTDGGDVDEPTPLAAPDANPTEPLETESAAPASADAFQPAARGTPETDEADSAPPRRDEDPPAAIDPGLSRAPSAPKSGRNTSQSEPTEDRLPSKQQADSRVVLFTATKWGG